MNNNFVTKLLASMLAVMMLLAVGASAALAEDSNVNKSGAPIVNETITLTVVGKENSGLDWNNQFLAKYIEETLGIKLEITTYTNDQWNTQLPLMLATNDLPDLFVGANIGKAENNEYGEEGFLLDFSEYTDYMPNYQALCEEYPLWAAYQKTTNGAVYGFSRLFPSRIGLATGLTMFVNSAWLENVGMSMPTTVDELYDVLVAFKEQDANGNGDPDDEIPLSIQIGNRTRGDRIWTLATAFGFFTNDSKFQADEDGTVYSIVTTDAYKAYIAYLHKLYAEGLMDASAFIQTDDERVDKIVSDRAGVFSDYSGLQVALGGADGSVYAGYEYLVGLTSEYNETSTFVLGNAGYAGGARTFASASTEYPEAVARLVDFFMSPEAVLLCDYGVEGETFNYVTDIFGNAVPSFTGFWEEGYESSTAYQNTLRLDEALKLIRSSALNEIIENASDEILYDMIYNDPDYTYTALAFKEKALRSVDQLVAPYPDLLYTDDENDERSTLSTDIFSYVSAMTSSFIMGEENIETGWDAFLAELEAMGLNRLVEIEQAAYDRFSN